MHEQLIIDNRTDPAQCVRTHKERRTLITTVISHKVPLLDSAGALICKDRRSGLERRRHY